MDRAKSEVFPEKVLESRFEAGIVISRMRRENQHRMVICNINDNRKRDGKGRNSFI